MKQTTGDKPTSSSLKGASIGAMICAVFGAAWIFWGVAWSGSHSATWFYTADVISVTMIGVAIVGIRKAFRSPSVLENVPSWRPSRGLYWLNTGTEWVLVAAAAIWLSHMDRSDLIPEVCGLIVGLHFFPLAAIFRVPIYYGTGTVIVIGETLSLIMPRGYGRNILGCGAVGLALWATAAVTLTWILKPSRPIDQAARARISNWKPKTE